MSLIYKWPGKGSPAHARSRPFPARRPGQPAGRWPGGAHGGGGVSCPVGGRKPAAGRGRSRERRERCSRGRSRAEPRSHRPGGDRVTAAGPGRARYRAARTYRSGAGGTSTALPMGLCFPCPGESAPPTPNPVSKAASARLPAAPRAPVPGLGAREARSCGHLPGRLGALERAGEHAGGHPGGGDVWSRPEGPWGRASGTWAAASVWSPTLVT